MEKFKRTAVIAVLLLLIILGTNRVVSAFSSGDGMNEQHMRDSYTRSRDTKQHMFENWKQHMNDMVQEGIISEAQAKEMYQQNSCHSYRSGDTSTSSETRQQMHGRR